MYLWSIQQWNHTIMALPLFFVNDEKIAREIGLGFSSRSITWLLHILTARNIYSLRGRRCIGIPVMNQRRSFKVYTGDSYTHKTVFFRWREVLSMWSPDSLVTSWLGVWLRLRLDKLEPGMGGRANEWTVHPAIVGLNWGPFNQRYFLHNSDSIGTW